MALRNGVIAREKRKTIVHGSSHSVPTFAAAASTFYGIRENSWSDQKVCYRVPAMTTLGPSDGTQLMLVVPGRAKSGSKKTKANAGSATALPHSMPRASRARTFARSPGRVMTTEQLEVIDFLIRER